MPEQWRVEHLPPDLGPHAITMNETEQKIQERLTHAMIELRSASAFLPFGKAATPAEEELGVALEELAEKAGELRKWVQDGINKHLEDFEP
jgi:hypothetical protein